MSWLKRKRGTPNQVGKPFPVGGKRRKLPDIVYPIRYEKKRAVIDEKRLFKRFFGMVTRSSYDRLKDNIVPGSQAHFMLKDGDTVLIGALPENKAEWRSLVRKAVFSEKPIAYAVITPIWLSPYTKYTKGVKPSAHPFRREGVFITAYSPFSKNSAFIEYEYLTPKIIEVKKPEVWPDFKDGIVGNVFR